MLIAFHMAPLQNSLALEQNSLKIGIPHLTFPIMYRIPQKRQSSVLYFGSSFSALTTLTIPPQKNKALAV